MKMGTHAEQFGQSVATADVVLLCENAGLKWDIHAIRAPASTLIEVKDNVDQVIEHLVRDCQRGDLVVIMSNGGFDNIHQKLIKAMQARP